MFIFLVIGNALCIGLQGPLGWQSPSGLPTETLLQGDVDFFTFADGDAEVSAISWEATIQKHIEEELYDASLKVCTFLHKTIRSCNLDET